MCERLVEYASKQTDPLFNLLSLNMKYLIPNKTCESCKQPAQEWFIIKVCHNTVCEKCLKHAKNKKASFCPVCRTKFDPEQDIITSNNMQTKFSQIQEFIYSILSIERGTSDTLYEDESNTRVTNKPSMIHIESVKIKRVLKNQSKANDDEPLEKKRTDEPICLNFDKNLTPIKNDMKITEHKQHLETTTLNEFQFNDFTKDSSLDYNNKSPSSNNNNMASNLENNKTERTSTNILLIEKNIEATELQQDPEITLSDEIQFNNFAVNSIKKSSQNCDNSDNLFQKTPNSILQEENNMKISEHEKGVEATTLDELKLNNYVSSDSIENSTQALDIGDEQQSSDSDSSASDSDDNMIFGTPNRSLVVSNPKNVFNRKDICISYSNFTKEELHAVATFYKMFKVRVSVEWSNEITHLIVKLDKDHTYARTWKCINALLSHCFILSEEWILKSISEKNIQPEQEFIPLDQSGEAAALQSWRIGRGIVDSSMLWTKHWVLFFHSSVKSHEHFADLKGWALKVGFMVIEQLNDFESVVSDLRIVLTDFKNPEKEIGAATDLELHDWLLKYKAVTVELDWYLEVLCRYRHVLIEPQYQVLKLSVSMMESAGIINESVIFTEHNY